MLRSLLVGDIIEIACRFLFHCILVSSLVRLVEGPRVSGLVKAEEVVRSRLELDVMPEFVSGTYHH